MTAALAVRGLVRRFGAHVAVNDVSFDVHAGEVCGFIGPNGAGKTTTMRVCSTLDLPDGGDVLVGGLSVLEHPREVRERLGFMPDSFGTYGSTTVTEYLDFFSRCYSLRGAARRGRLAEVIEFTGLGPLVEKEIRALSKGMKQRLCLAKTLLHDPEVMILDEPAAGLDPRARVELRELLKALAGLGKAVLVSSHILTELAEMCDSVVVIELGRVRARGPLEGIAREMRPHVEVRVRALAPREELEQALLETPGVQRVRRDGDALVFDCARGDAEVSAILTALVGRGLRPVEFAPREADLEELFLSLTKGQVQ